METIRTYLDAKKDGRPQILLGDLNAGSGVANTDIVDFYATNYETLLEDGYINAYYD